MRKQSAWSLGGATVLVGIMALIWNSGPSLPTLRFADGTSTRILKVSVGTRHTFSWEPVWKRCLRKLSPATLQKALGPARQSEFTTPHDSLVLYLETMPNASPFEKRSIEAVFADGTESVTEWRASFSTSITINNYPREQKEVLLRFKDQLSRIEIKVPNPRPAKRESWSARPLPQTNHVAGTRTVLKHWRAVAGNVRRELVLDAKSTTDVPVSWTQWRTTLLDPLGNWSTDTSTRKPILPGAKSERVFKLLAEGNEYISAGFFPMLTNQQHQIIPLKPRMTNWGVRFVALFGPGTYEVSKTFQIKTRNAGLAATNLLKAAGSSWFIECVQPVSLCISERAVSDVRLRERFPNNQGRIFYGAPTTSLSKGGLTAQLFTPRLRAPLFAPVTGTATTNILEVEVVVRWPPVEFFVQKPE